MADDKAVDEVMEDGFFDISEEKDGSLLKKILEQGVGDEQPPVGCEVTVHYTGTLHSDGSKFDSSKDRGKHFVTDIGVGRVIRGWDVGICTMKRGEKAILRAKPHYAYGESGSPPVIPANATLNFEVELFSWKEKVKDPEEMTAEERSEFATKQKELGTEAFKAQSWDAAAAAYAEGARYITFGQRQRSSCCGPTKTCQDHGDGMDEDVPALGDEDKKLALALLTNCAMARLKSNEPELAVSTCDKALEFDPENVKAIFRRGKARLALHEHDAAVQDAAAVLKLEPDNKDAETLRKQAELEKKREKVKQKALYSKMFG
jgi:peptidylprolyl isomerase